MKKKVAVLGSTGSIGKQALDVISRNSDKFELEVITAGQNAELLIRQSLQYNPGYAVIADDSLYNHVKQALSGSSIQVLSGPGALKEIVTLPVIDIVLTAMVGFAGLPPTIAAIEAGKNIALANKETLVVAGELITLLSSKHHTRIYPVDSEHSAIFQCILGENPDSIEKIILTASGGPFRGMSKSQLQHVTKFDALQHPVWCMGNKVTIDSATLMNKGLEAIEAHWLFNLPPERIEIIIHAQSVIHSLVQFADGSIKAQMGVPDMRMPIQYALAYPDRLPSSYSSFNFMNYPQLTFEKPDNEVFRCLDLAYEAMQQGGNMPCILNAANEVAVKAFLNDRIAFYRIPDFIENAMAHISFIKHPALEDYYETDRLARAFTSGHIGK
ncbi:MAG: 1-deoxy-D-xylulose-5-phosphate reductoisomerase [Bacteroidales bacterium]|nr:1-deoxy-D-xylulose-5-phosphate reductoisomerase [Bacteroidales bacterium]